MVKETLLSPTYKIVFQKKDGQERTIRCKFDPDYYKHPSNKEEYLVVFDVDKQGYRTVNKNTVSYLGLAPY